MQLVYNAKAHVVRHCYLYSTRHIESTECHTTDAIRAGAEAARHTNTTVTRTRGTQTRLTQSHLFIKHQWYNKQPHTVRSAAWQHLGGHKLGWSDTNTNISTFTCTVTHVIATKTTKIISRSFQFNHFNFYTIRHVYGCIGYCPLDDTVHDMAQDQAYRSRFDLRTV